jgi:hypothetical protein
MPDGGRAKNHNAERSETKSSFPFVAACAFVVNAAQAVRAVMLTAARRKTKEGWRAQLARDATLSCR